MHNRSKSAILSALTNLIWFILTFIWHRSRLADLTAQANPTNHTSPTNLPGEPLARAWGVYFLLLVLGFLVLNIISVIVVMTFEKRQGSKGFAEPTDERDHHIEGYAMKAFGLVFSLAFLAAAALLALGFGLQTFFYALAFMVLLSGLAMWITYIVGYERGL